MADPFPEAPDGTMPSVPRFVLSSLAMLILLGVLSVALRLLASFEVGSTSMLIVPLVVGALVTGSSFARRHGALPARTAAWRIAWRGAVAFQLASAGLAIGLTRALGGSGLAGVPWWILAGVVAALFIVAALVNRVFVRMGAKNRLRAAAR